MCGRYRLSRRKQLVEEYFDTTPWEEDWNPRFNIAPTQPVPVIRQHPKEPLRQLSVMKWGLIPHWAKNPSIAMSTINAKSETAATKPEKYRKLPSAESSPSPKATACLTLGTGVLTGEALWLGSTGWLIRFSKVLRQPTAGKTSTRRAGSLPPDCLLGWHAEQSISGSQFGVAILPILL